MKNFKSYIACMTIFVFLFTSCSKDDENGTAPGSEKAILSFGTVLNDLVSNRSAIKQQLGNIPNCSDDLPAFVEVVLSREGVAVVGTVANPLRVNVNPNSSDYNGDGAAEYFTDESSSLELEPGTYSLEYFQVLNEGLEVIWIAPIEDEENESFAGFVDNPLPFQFFLESGEKKYVDVEVLCFDDRLVNYYGYLFFDIEGAEAIEFCIFGNYCFENGRHADATRYSVSVWNYSENPENPQGDVLYTDLENVFLAIDYEDSGIIVATPLCIVLPDREGLDEYYFEITLLENDPELIRSGVITDEDVRALFDGEDNLDYYHFREGNCNLGDFPSLFESAETVPPTIVDLTTDENRNLTFTTMEVTAEVIKGSSDLLGYGVISSENSNPTLDGDRFYEYESPFRVIMSGLSPGTTYFYKIYAITAEGNYFSEERSFTTPSITNITWDFYFLHEEGVSWHADVTFYEDGTAFYTEPAAPGIYDFWGTWTLEANELNYDMEGDNDRRGYWLTGTLDGEEMSGTYTWSGLDKPWTAAVRKN